MTMTNTTRRAILGAIAFSPAVMATTTIAEATTSAGTDLEWAQAYAAFAKIESATEDFDRDHHTPAMDRWHSVRDKWPMNYNFTTDTAARAEINAASNAFQPFEDELERYHEAHNKALAALLLTPAPTVAALAVKLELARKYGNYDDNDGDAYKLAIIGDARRLAI